MENKTWKLFLDDERMPGEDLGNDVIIARTCDEAICLINLYGLPSLISFDHDLGEDRGGNVMTSMTLLHWLVDNHLDNKINVLNISRVIIHSANPVGSRNIESLWNCFADNIDSQIKAELRPKTSF